MIGLREAKDIVDGCFAEHPRPIIALVKALRAASKMSTINDEERERFRLEAEELAEERDILRGEVIALNRTLEMLISKI